MMYNPDNPVGAALFYVRWKWLRSRLRFSRSICPLHRSCGHRTRYRKLGRAIEWRGSHSARRYRSVSFARRCRPFWHATAFPQSPHIRRLRAAGGLVSYGPDRTALVSPIRFLRRPYFTAARNQAICHFSSQRCTELVINLKAAKALDLTVPNTLLVAADEVIE